MNIEDIIQRSMPPEEDPSGGKIPWNDPAFSQRMLAQHLSDEHDWASRRSSIIETQVRFLDSLLPRASAILDLGCGPGLYDARLARLGHQCTGVDFSPASIEHARLQARTENLDIRYELADIRQYRPQPAGFDAVLMLFGEINVFTRGDAEGILKTARTALKPGGLLVLEAHTFDEVKCQGQQGAEWQSFASGLFSERPHLLLQEHFWNQKKGLATTRYYVLEADQAKVTPYTSAMTAYNDQDYREMLLACGFANLESPPASAWPVGQAFEKRLEVRLARV